MAKYVYNNNKYCVGTKLQKNFPVQLPSEKSGGNIGS